MEKNGRFIELTFRSGEKVIVNVDAITSIKDAGAYRVILFTNGNKHLVNNSYAELKEATGIKTI